ncbi:MAG: N-6 DNA methylase, partial [Desulfatitalea sp.]
MAPRNAHALMYDTIRLEGALFAPDLLEKAARGALSHQTESDYQVPKGLRLQDEYGRAFQIAMAQWSGFTASWERLDLDAAAAARAYVHEFLRDVLGYGDLCPAEPVELGGRRYPVHFMAAGRLPVVVAPRQLSLDEADPLFAVEGSGSRKKSAAQLAQELLNAGPDFTWALVSNGCRIRLLRDAATLTRPTFLEFDLETIFSEKRYPDFIALWRLLHASRMLGVDGPESACAWEKWRQAGIEQGTRVREGLRVGVTQALIGLGTGFLQHPANEALRQELRAGRLTTEAYFRQLLRLIYRFLLLFTVEERGQLHLTADTPEAEAARQVYSQGYALRRLRERALRRAGFDGHGDLWHAVKIVFRCLIAGEPALALPALGGLFAADQCPYIDACELSNQALLGAMRDLRWTGTASGLSPVDYRNMGPEELGSIYESLLEMVPDVDLVARRFGFIGLTEEGSTTGHARKTTGSYYTPDHLVVELITTALEPVMEQRLAERPDHPVEALLNLAVVDPACGSGHFLLAAARRLAERLVELEAMEGGARPEAYPHALRRVIAHCIHGVDRNPMALELARTALWLEGFEPGQPLSFLDHHLICGDSLLGLVDLRQMAEGIPDEAFKPLSGDDKKLCSALMTANRMVSVEFSKRRKGIMDLFADNERKGALQPLQALEAMPDATPAEVDAKEKAWRAFLENAGHSPLARAADLFMGTFLMPKSDPSAAPQIPNSLSLEVELFGGVPTQGHEEQVQAARQYCQKARVLHWPLAFAQVFSRGGFDCVLGNPPWERIKLQEEEFFATRHAEIAAAKNKAERGRRIQWLAEGMLARHLHPELALQEDQGDPGQRGDAVGKAEKNLHAEFITARRTAEAISLYAHLKVDQGGRYPLTGVGDVNTYALFAETNSRIRHPRGRAGFIVPTGIATDDSTKAFFSAMALSGQLASLYDFENRDAIFPGVHRSYKFCLLTIGASPAARFKFFLTHPSQLADERRGFALRPEDFALINPNTRTCPIFRGQRDAEITQKIYRRVPVLICEADEETQESNPWGISFMRMFDMSNDSHLFEDYDGGEHLPLYEAKMIHQFDHRWATYH